MQIFIKAGETDATKRRVVFHLMNDDGSPATGEAGNQPQIMVNEAAWTNTGIGVLLNPGGAGAGVNPEGRYYAILDASIVVTAGTRIETTHTPAGGPAQPGDSVRVTAMDLNVLDSTGVWAFLQAGATVPDSMGEAVLAIYNLIGGAGGVGGGAAPSHLVGRYTTGSSAACFVRINHLGQIWNVAEEEWQAYNVANVDDYAIAAVEVGTTGVYMAVDPGEGVAGESMMCIKTGTGGTVLTITDVRNAVWQESHRPAADSIMSFMMDGGFAFRQTFNMMAATLLGTTDGAGTSTNLFRAVGGVAPRVESEFDGEGNRITVTLTPDP